MTIFDNFDDPVSIEPKMTNWSSQGIYFMDETYSGDVFVDDLETFARIVYLTTSKECQADMEDLFLYCKVLKHIEKVKNDINTNARASKRQKKPTTEPIPNSFYDDSLKSSNVFIRVHFPKNKLLEDALLVFEVDYWDYKFDFEEQAQILLQDAADAEFDWYEKPLKLIVEANSHLAQGYHLIPSTLYRNYDYDPGQWATCAQEHNKQFEESVETLRRDAQPVSQTPARTRSLARRTTNNKVTGVKRSRSALSSNGDSESDENDENSNENVESDIESNGSEFEEPPQKKHKKEKQVTKTRMSLRSSTLKKRKESEEKQKEKAMAKQSKAKRGRGKASIVGKRTKSSSVAHTPQRRTRSRATRGKGKGRKGRMRTSSNLNVQGKGSRESESEHDSNENTEPDSNDDDKSTQNDSASSNHVQSQSGSETETDPNDQNNGSESDNNDSGSNNNERNSEHESAEDYKMETLIDKSLTNQTMIGADSDMSDEENKHTGNVLLKPKRAGSNRRRIRQRQKRQSSQNDVDLAQVVRNNNDNSNPNENENANIIDVNVQTGVLDAAEEESDNMDLNEAEIAMRNNALAMAQANRDLEDSERILANFGRTDPDANNNDSSSIKKGGNRNNNGKKSNAKNSILKPTVDSEYATTSDEEEETKMDYSLGYDVNAADEIDFLWIQEGEFENTDQVKFTVFHSGSPLGVPKECFSSNSKTALLGHRGKYLSLMKRGLYLEDNLMGKVFDVSFGDLSFKFKTNGNYTALTQFFVHMKRDIAIQWYGEPENDNIQWIPFNEESLQKYYSYYNIPSFGGKTGGGQHTGWKNLRIMTHQLGPVLIMIKHLNKEKKALRRLARELLLPNGRYQSIKPIDVANQLRCYQGQHSAIKDLTNIVYLVIKQTICGACILVWNGVLDYDTGKLDIQSDQWDFLPNIKDPIMLRLGLLEKPSKRYVFLLT